MRIPLALLLLTTALTTFSQSPAPDDVHASLLTGKKRSLIAYAGQSHSFTLDVSPTAKPSDVPGFITVDKQILQSTLVPLDKSIDLNNLNPAREQEILTHYMNFELTYYKKKLHQNYTNLRTEWITLQNRIFLVWYFDLPNNQKLISRQIYVSTLFFDQIMDLNAPIFHPEDAGKAKALLLRLAGTIKTFDTHLDLVALQKKLKGK
ncbi:MAG TPA: hypothetical protein VFE32_01275 [Puia sp.]|jgi:hypothetical protein|nr:hypothetical protein [Puia sp.]